MQQFRIGVPLTLLLAARMSVNALATGKISLGRDGDILLAKSPIEFWCSLIGIMAITVFGTWMAVRYRESIWGVWGINRHKGFEYFGLFCVLAFVYSVSLSSYLKFIAAAPYGIEFVDLMRPLVNFCIVSALPFAGLAYFDRAWHSSDAAPVCVAAWVVVSVGVWPKYGDICPLAILLPFFPFILAALLAHTLGRFFNIDKTATT